MGIRRTVVFQMCTLPWKRGIHLRRDTLCPGSVTKRLLCIHVQSTYECKTRGEERGTVLHEVKPMHTTRNQFHSKMRSHAPSKPSLIATFLLRFRQCLRATNCYKLSDTL